MRYLTKSLVAIDPDDIGAENLRQPKMTWKVAVDLLPLAKKKLAEAEAALEVVEAELKQRIRRNPAKYGVDKITEGAVKEAMIVHPKYRKAVQLTIDLKHAVDVLSGSMTTLDHRKKSIEGHITLRGQGYFSAPRVKDDAAREEIRRLEMRRKRKLRGGGYKPKGG